MAMAKKMTFDRAQEIAKIISDGRAKYGRQFSPPYSEGELMDVIAVLKARLDTSVPAEEHALLKKQLQAANARAAKSKPAATTEESK
jgi:hypothetical protein